ncbi:hypothetical protein [Dactylosporangium sp. CS-033363]|uniref:hypothetical protein n=1 Tax=Dactylosporangium sp. CS-033363 TaxID=3239935 RepID=UPI003D914F46
MTVEIEVTGVQPVPEPPERARNPRRTLSIAIALAVGAAFGFAVAAARPAPRTSAGVATAPSIAVASDTGLSAQETADMVRRVAEYNKRDPAAVETTPERFMSGRRNNITRLDDDRSYPAGEYRLQVICLGDGQVWGLFRIGDDETYVDMDCHADRVLFTQLLLTAHAGGRRTVTAVTDAPLGVAIGLQILQKG